ncbi:transposase [Aquimarina litoralis]
MSSYLLMDISVRVKKLKGYSSRDLQCEFLKSNKQYWNRCFWSLYLKYR